MNHHLLHVLIADDEPVIREGIRDSIYWASLQMEVKAEAEDGEEALELAVKHSVDILLADLNMPIMNGISLIKQVREKLPHCKIIIITGHDEFSYAQEAVRLNVVDYILKPVDPNQLRNVLEQIRQELEETLHQKKYLDIANQQIERNKSLLREQFCLEWLHGNVSDEEVKSQLAFFQLPPIFPSHLAVIQASEYLANKPIMSEKEKQKFEIALKDIVKELIGPSDHVFIRDEMGMYLFFIWNENAVTLFESVEQVLKERLKTTIHFTIEEVGFNQFSVAEAYKHCMESLENESIISPIVRRARDYIEGHYTERTITLDFVANTLQVSPVYLSRTIKQELGISFVSLVTNMRIKKAIHLLNSTNLPIVEIAEEVGYDTQHYFSTAFKKVIGVSPNKYRKQIGLESM